MKKYLTEKTVALGMAALLVCGVAIGSALSSDKSGDLSERIERVGESCDCVDCPGGLTVESACSCGCVEASNSK